MHIILDSDNSAGIIIGVVIIVIVIVATMTIIIIIVLLVRRKRGGKKHTVKMSKVMVNQESESNLRYVATVSYLFPYIHNLHLQSL